MQELYDRFAETETVALGGGCAIDITADGGTVLLPPFGVATVMSITIQPVGRATPLDVMVLVPPNAVIGDCVSLFFNGEKQTFFTPPTVLGVRLVWSGPASHPDFEGTCTGKRHWRYNGTTPHSTLVAGGRWPTSHPTGGAWDHIPQMFQPELPSYKFTGESEAVACCWCNTVHENVEAYTNSCVQDTHTPF